MANQQTWSLENLRLVVKNVLDQNVDPALLKKAQHLPRKDPMVSFRIIQDQDGTIFIKIKARHGPFGESVHKTKWKYYSITYINWDSIFNQLMNTLTWEGSPYYWYKTHFKQRMVVAG